MATKKTTTKKAEALTLEQRVERIERDLVFLGAKLRTHGIHLAPEENPEAQEQAEE